MRLQSESLHPLLSRCLYIYAILATIYTLGNLCFSLLRYQSFSRNRLLPSPPPRITLPPSMTAQQAEEFLWSNFSLSGHSVAWNPILSRAFPRLMHPSRIIPHYYRATGRFENDDITVTTLISNDRFPVFLNLVQRYKGVLVPLFTLSIHPRRSFRTYIRHNTRIFALSGRPCRSSHYVYVLTGIFNLRRRPSCSLPIPNVRGV
jgi:hypothetical protein